MSESNRRDERTNEEMAEDICAILRKDGWSEEEIEDARYRFLNDK